MAVPTRDESGVYGTGCKSQATTNYSQLSIFMFLVCPKTVERRQDDPGKKFDILEVRKKKHHLEVSDTAIAFIYNWMMLNNQTINPLNTFQNDNCT